MIQGLFFGALEIGSNFDDFSGVSGVTQISFWLVVICSSPTLSNTIPGSLKPDSRDPETEAGNLETEKRAHRIHEKWKLDYKGSFAA